MHGWNPQKPAKQDGNDTIILSYHPLHLVPFCKLCLVFVVYIGGWLKVIIVLDNRPPCYASGFHRCVRFCRHDRICGISVFCLAAQCSVIASWRLIVITGQYRLGESKVSHDVLAFILGVAIQLVCCPAVMKVCTVAVEDTTEQCNTCYSKSDRQKT